MITALLTDIHSNREALEACLNHAQAHGARRYAFLGDYIGYGADPEWVIDTLIEYQARGAIAILGNHDAAAVSPYASRLHAAARQAIEWTIARLNTEQSEFLAKLPLMAEQDDCLYVHASAALPAEWEYVTGTAQAAKSMLATERRIVFSGHVHEPALYHISATGNVSSFSPSCNSNIHLSTQRRWLAIPGSAGQPRDGNPAACYALFDDVNHELIFSRVPYDYESAAAKIRAAGLPEQFAARLERGA